MRRRYMIGTVMAGSALLAACGSTSTQSLKPTPAPTAKKSTTTTSATTSEYLNIYQGIPNSPVSSNGYPFSVPDSMRILAPSLLKKEVLDTKLAKIGDTYVGNTWTPAQRMEIYTAKMFMLYGNVFGLPQYLTTTGTYGTTNKAILTDIGLVSAPFYGSVAAADKQLGVTSTSDGLSFFRGDIKGTQEGGANTLVQPYLDASVPPPKGNIVSFTMPNGSFMFKSTGQGAGTATGEHNTVVVMPDPGAWSHVWEVSQSGIQFTS